MTKRPTTSRRPHKMIDRTTPPGYRYHALYKTSAGIETPKLTKATPDAASVFFCVRHMRHFMAWCAIHPQGLRCRLAGLLTHHAAHNGAVCVPYSGFTPFFRVSNSTLRRRIMVALAGQPQGWPVSFVPGSLNPANVTAPIEIETSCGDPLTRTKEAAAMVATLTPLHPEFTFYFLAVRRSDLTDRPHREIITAPDEMTARRLLAGRFVLCFAGRVPAQEVRHV
ncbi:ash family protein [Salmonella enterica]|nr:ash family protein [Salmonella enterica]EFT4171016.1 ash family protein [Salmonella enterica]EGH3250188.1 ash family protein [Salmonella enterica]EGS4228478.1 ash family protein [Salmonella enterica]EGW8101259.1 ash family protein [Salmonella enterica]